MSGILRRLDAVQTAMAADRDHILVPGFEKLGKRMAEFRWVLGVVEAGLAELRQLIASQGADQRGKMRAAQDSLDDITGLLQRVVAAQEDRDGNRDGAPRAGNGQPPASPPLPPYPGMRPFGSRDAKWFFGREDLTAHLVNRLAEQVGARAPLFVLGPSGIGKSSLLRAGLIPALRRGERPVPGSRRWPRIVLDRPGARPLAALAAAMAGRAGPAGGPAAPGGTDGDPAAVAAALTGGAVPPSRLVLVVDQFEDIFTQCADEGLRLQFIRVLLALSRPPAGSGAEHGALVVLGVRADFYQDCAGVAELRALLPDNQLVVGPLAEAVTRRILLRLVTAGPGTQLTRRRVGRAALVAGLDAPAADVSLARFTQARLVVADAEGVEITHEAFLDAWPRLREWIADDRAGLRLTISVTSQVHDLEFSPNGSLLAVVGQDANVSLRTVPGLRPWAELAQPAPSAPASGLSLIVNRVAFGGDGHTLVAVNGDGVAQVWDLRPIDEVRNLCNALRGPGLARQWRQQTSAPNPCRAG